MHIRTDNANENAVSYGSPRAVLSAAVSTYVVSAVPKAAQPFQLLLCRDVVRLDLIHGVLVTELARPHPDFRHQLQGRFLAT